MPSTIPTDYEFTRVPELKGRIKPTHGVGLGELLLHIERSKVKPGTAAGKFAKSVLGRTVDNTAEGEKDVPTN